MFRRRTSQRVKVFFSSTEEIATPLQVGDIPVDRRIALATAPVLQLHTLRLGVHQLKNTGIKLIVQSPNNQEDLIYDTQ